MTGSDFTHGRTADGALSAAEFADLLAPLGIADQAPKLAVGVSGGADSMALAVLLHEWAAARGGTIRALIVDHGLRPESSRQAHCAAGWLTERGVHSEILSWRGPKPGSGVQAAARAARYRLMTRWCLAHGVADLLLAHHRDDQAETFLLRLGRGSGIDGLACMARVARSPIAGAAGVRLVRPLLPVPKVRLTATVKYHGVPWIEDPSNQDPRFARVRVRQALKDFAGEGFGSERLSIAARRMERAGDALRRVTQDFLDRCAVRDPAGFCELPIDDFRHAAEEISLRALARMLIWAGGPGAAPRLERVERLHHQLVIDLGFSGRTLGGCRIEVRGRARERGPCVFVCREAGAVTQEVPLSPGAEESWDGRFQVALGVDGDGGRATEIPVVRRLGEDGWRQISPAVSDFVRRRIPAPARPSLPALWDRNGVISVPLVHYRRPDSNSFPALFTTDVRWRELGDADRWRGRAR